MSQETINQSAEESFGQTSFTDHILKIIPGIINIYDLVDQRNVYTNHNILELLGYSPEHIKNLGVSTIDFMLHPEDVTKVPQIITQLTQTNEGEIVEFAFRARHANGEWRWMNSRNTVFSRTAENHPKQIFSLIEDVTIRKVMDEEIKNNALKYRTLFETSTDAIYLETLEGRIIDCNETACRMLGYSKEELTTLTVADLVPESVAEMLPKLIEEEQTTGGAFVEALNRRKDGEIFPCEVSTRLITLDGQPRILAYVRDITARKKAEEERDRYFEMSLDLLCIADTEGYFHRLNPEWEQTLGYSLDEMEGRRFWDFIHPDDMEATLAAVSQLENQEILLNFENRYRCKDGAYRWIEWRSFPYGKLIYAAARDISGRKQVEENLKNHIEEMSALHAFGKAVTENLSVELTIHSALEEMHKTVRPDLVFFFLRDNDRLILKEVLPATEYTQFGAIPEHRVGDCICGLTVTLRQSLFSKNIFHDSRCTWDECKRAGIKSFAALPLFKEGEVIGVIGLASKNERDYARQEQFLATLASQASTAIINALMYETLEKELAERKRRETERMVLLEIMQGAATTKDVHEFIRLIHNAISKVIYSDNFFVVFYNKNTGLFEEIYSVDQYDQPAPPSKLKNSITSYVFHTSEPLLITNTQFDEMVAQGLMKLVGTNSACWLGAPIKTPQETIGVIAVQHYEDPACYTEGDKEFLASIGAQVSIALERKITDENLQASETRYRAVVENSPFGMHFYELKPDSSLIFCGGNPSADLILGTSNSQFVGKTIEEAFPGLVDTEVPDRYRTVARDGGVWQIDQVEYDEGNIRGAYAVTAFQTSPSFIAVMFTDITERKQAADRIQRQMQNLAALNTIDRAIASSLDLQITLNIVLTHVINQLGVHAAIIFLFNKSMNVLEISSYNGFRNNLVSLNVWNRDALVWQAIIKNKLVSSSDILPVDQIPGEDFKYSYAAPLIAKGEIKGVLQIYHRAKLIPDEDWKNMLQTLAEQTAIAIDNFQLFENLQRSNAELSQAYSATLEGWSAALDLRDKETEGHSQRVMEFTIKIAQTIGVKDRELVDIRRGALLHDMGKIGIPDTILQNPGPLSEDEWVIMRKHPEYAYQLLWPIIHLRSSLDIPYCHHEKWDGTGYPRGLKGEDIPLAARIFAVVDVWDALLSDRPYRAAWSREEALDYIRAQAGAHFDPQIVDIFLSLVGDR